MADRIILAGPVRDHRDGSARQALLFVYDVSGKPVTPPPDGVAIIKEWDAALQGFPSERAQIVAGTHVASDWLVEIADDEADPGAIFKLAWQMRKALTIRRAEAFSARTHQDKARGTLGDEFPVK